MNDDRAIAIGQQLLYAARAFSGRFGRAPRFAACAPGRVNLIGEHTDYNDGFVLPMAIDRQALIVVDTTSAGQSTFIAHDLNESLAVDLRGQISSRPGHWSRMLLGVVRRFAPFASNVQNLDALLTSTVPIGAGLSSSAAIGVAMATIMEQVTGTVVAPLEKARLCQRAEHECVGTPCGIMDMFVATHASLGQAMLIDCRELTFQNVPMPAASDATVLVVDTRTPRSLAQGEYARRRAECESAARKLGMPSLRHATLAMLRSPPLAAGEHRRALHVVAENGRTVMAATALGEGDLRSFGQWMYASHDSLRDLFEVSCPQLDAVVAAAKELPGDEVFGARMTGGGFGGCAIILSPSDAADNVTRHVAIRFAAAFGIEPVILPVRPAGAAQLLSLAGTAP